MIPSSVAFRNCLFCAHNYYQIFVIIFLVIKICVGSWTSSYNLWNSKLCCTRDIMFIIYYKLFKTCNKFYMQSITFTLIMNLLWVSLGWDDPLITFHSLSITETLERLYWSQNITLWNSMVYLYFFMDFNIIKIHANLLQFVDIILEEMCLNYFSDLSFWSFIQILSHRGYDSAAADVWYYGVILYVLMARYLPFDMTDLLSLFNKVSLLDSLLSNIYILYICSCRKLYWNLAHSKMISI